MTANKLTTLAQSIIVSSVVTFESSSIISMVFVKIIQYVLSICNIHCAGCDRVVYFVIVSGRLCTQIRNLEIFENLTQSWHQMKAE